MTAVSIDTTRVGHIVAETREAGWDIACGEGLSLRVERSETVEWRARQRARLAARLEEATEAELRAAATELEDDPYHGGRSGGRGATAHNYRAGRANEYAVEFVRDELGRREWAAANPRWPHDPRD